METVEGRTSAAIRTTDMRIATPNRVKLQDDLNRSDHTVLTVRTFVSASSANTATSARSRVYHGVYLPNSHAMRATQSSLALVSLVLSFDIVELWSNSDDDGELRCVYAHVIPELQALYPNIIAGHYPQQKRKDHSMSPNLCRMAKTAPEKYFWSTNHGHDAPATKVKTKNYMTVLLSASSRFSLFFTVFHHSLFTIHYSPFFLFTIHYSPFTYCFCPAGCCSNSIQFSRNTASRAILNHTSVISFRQYRGC